MHLHSAVIFLMKALNYKADSYGICYGFMNATLPAMLLQDWKTVNKRLKLISMITLENDDPVILRMRFTSALLYCMVTNNEVAGEIQCFFDAIELGYQPELYPEHFPSNITLNQCWEKTLPLTMPIQLETALRQLQGHSQLPVTRKYNGAFTRLQLEHFFGILRPILMHHATPTVLVVSTTTHANLVSFDPIKQCWVIADIFIEYIQPIKSVRNISDELMYCLTDKGIAIAIFSVQFININYDLILELELALQSNLAWQRLFSIDEFQIKLADFHQTSLIHCAAQNDDLPLVQAIYNLDPAQLRRTTDYQQLPLHLAAEAGHLETVSFILRNSSQRDLLDADQNTPLHLAVYYNHLEVAKLLLMYSSNPNHENDEKQTPIHYALTHAWHEMIKLLLGFGAILPDNFRAMYQCPHGEVTLLPLLERHYQLQNSGEVYRGAACAMLTASIATYTNDEFNVVLQHFHKLKSFHQRMPKLLPDTRHQAIKLSDMKVKLQVIIHKITVNPLDEAINALCQELAYCLKNFYSRKNAHYKPTLFSSTISSTNQAQKNKKVVHSLPYK